MDDQDTRRLVHQAALDSYNRLVAYLASRSRDVAGAEDALGDAFLAALETWPRAGIPQKPEAWLLTAAHRKLIDTARHARVQVDAMPTLASLAEEAQTMASSVGIFPDERLKVLFICAHPAIDAAVRTPLMLQIVMGLDAARIASTFLVSPPAMSARLARAKAKIRDAGIRFEVPEADELSPRLEAVLEAIYAAYGKGWDDIAGADPRCEGMTAEAIDLGRLLSRLMPSEPEVNGLLALMLHCEARRGARRTVAGQYVPLSEQDATVWSQPMIAEAEQCLKIAARAGKIGRFQLEAAIQSVHAQRACTGITDWETIALMYEGLVRLAPTIGGMVGRAAAIAQARGADAGWSLLQAVPADAARSYQPYWALAANLLTRLQQPEEAEAAYSRAADLCEDPAVRQFLAQRS